MPNFSQETHPVEIGDEIRSVDLRTLEHRPLVKRVTGVIKGPRGGLLSVLYVVNTDNQARRCPGGTWQKWHKAAEEEAAALSAQQKAEAARRLGGLKHIKPSAVAEPAAPEFTETRDVLMKPVQRRCRGCPRIFETRVLTQWDCPACTAKARAAEQAAKEQGAASPSAKASGDHG